MIDTSLPLIHVSKTNPGIQDFLLRHYGHLDAMQANTDLAGSAGFAHWSISDADPANPRTSWIERALAATRRLPYSEAIPVTDWTVFLYEPSLLNLGDVTIQLLYGQRESHRQVIDLEPCFFCFYAERQQVQAIFTSRLEPAAFDGGLEVYAPAGSADDLDPRWGLSTSPRIVFPHMAEPADLDCEPAPRLHRGPEQRRS